MSISFADYFSTNSDLTSPLYLPSSFCLEQGIYGGLVMGLAAGSISKASRFPLRVLQLNLCGLALPEKPTTINVLSQRLGHKTESLAITLSQDENIVAHGTGFCGLSRNTQPDETNEPFPEVRPFETVAPVQGGQMLPPYAQHLELRPCWGENLFSNGPLKSGGWVKFKEAPDQMTEAALAALIDSWWPANLVRGLRPMATVSIQISFSNPSSLPPDAAYLLTTETRTLHEGFATELDTLWTETGQLVASAQQVIAIIK